LHSFNRYDAERLEKIVEDNKARFVGRELTAQTLGVVGLGQVGVRVANLGVQKGMRVVGFDTHLSIQNAHQLDRKVELMKKLDDLLALSNIITVHVPLTDATSNLIGAVQIERMQNGTMLVNYSRKGVCDDAAVLAGIEGDKIGSYVSDFPTPELLRNTKVICTPHLGASTEESEDKCAEMAVRQLKAFLETGSVTNSVNFPTLELMPKPNVRTRLVVVNRDVPKMIATITGAIASEGVNITGYVNDGNGVIGYNLIDIESEVSPEVLSRINQTPDVLNVRAIPMR